LTHNYTITYNIHKIYTYTHTHTHTHTHIYIYIYIYIYTFYNIVRILYLRYLVYIIFSTLEEEGVLFIYSHPLIYYPSNIWRKEVMDRIHLDYWG